jgi:hypothetical protein
VCVVSCAIRALPVYGRLEITVLLHQILLQTGEKCYGSFKNIGSSFWRVENRKDTSFFEWFSKFKIAGTSDKGAKCLGHPESKRDVIVDGMKKLGLKNRRITTCEAANILQISLGSVQSKNGQRSGICQNSCSTMAMHLFTLLWPCM